MADPHTNFARSTVVTAPSPATSGTSVTVASGDGALFATVPMQATIWPTNAEPTASTAEIVTIAVRNTDTLTITRTREGTSARTIVVGDQIAATITSLTLDDLEGNRAPTVSRRVRDGYSQFIATPYTIEAGVVLTIEANGVVTVL